MSAAHTLGPWHRGSDEHSSPELWSDIYAANGALVARVAVGNVTSKERGTEHARVRSAANAMAAAPEMHEANKASLMVLCALERANDWHPNMQKDIAFAIEANRAAIAKATGSAS